MGVQTADMEKELGGRGEGGWLALLLLQRCMSLYQSIEDLAWLCGYDFLWSSRCCVWYRPCTVINWFWVSSYLYSLSWMLIIFCPLLMGGGAGLGGDKGQVAAASPEALVVVT